MIKRGNRAERCCVCFETPGNMVATHLCRAVSAHLFHFFPVRSSAFSSPGAAKRFGPAQVCQQRDEHFLNRGAAAAARGRCSNSPGTRCSTPAPGFPKSTPTLASNRAAVYGAAARTCPHIVSHSCSGPQALQLVLQVFEERGAQFASCLEQMREQGSVRLGSWVPIGSVSSACAEFPLVQSFRLPGSALIAVFTA